MSGNILYRYRCTLENAYVWESRLETLNPPTVCKNDLAAIQEGSLVIVEDKQQVLNLDHNTDLLHVGVHTHDEIDEHLTSTANPHLVTRSQVGLGNVENTKVNLTATTDPTTTNDSSQGYSINSCWVNVTLQKAFVCLNATINAAVWKRIDVTDHALLSNIGSLSHAQLDNHVNSTSNPHGVSRSQVGLGNVENTKVNLTATTDPSTTNDTTQGYSLGSFWVNSTTQKAFTCLSATTNAAVWRRIDVTDHTLLSNVGTNSHASIDAHIANTSNPHSVNRSQVGLGNVENTKVNLTATTDPSTTNDTVAGYSVSSLWFNVTTQKGFVCVNATTNAAVWRRIDITDHTLLSNVGNYNHSVIDSHIDNIANPHATTKQQVGLGNVENTKVNLTATTDPLTTSDSASGYSVNSVWINTSTQKAFVCLSATVSAAVWRRIDVTDHTLLSNVGSLTHSQLDAHVNSTSNPHLVDKIQVGLSNVVNTKVNLSATSDPLTTSDSASGYSVNSVWINTSSQKAFVCLNATTSAAVWRRIDVTDHTLLSNIGNYSHSQLDSHVDNMLNPHSTSKQQVGLGNVENTKVNLTATTDPSTTSDNVAGYSVSSLWFNVTTQKGFVCVNATTNAAVWRRIDITDHTLLSNVGTNSHASIDAHIADTTNNVHNVTRTQVGLGNVENTKVNLTATTDPLVTSDSASGYSVGSTWQNVTAQKSFICLASTVNAAVWKRIDITDHTLLSNVGTNSHASIDAHIANTNNPHLTNKSQVGLGNVDNIKNNLVGTTAPSTSNDASGGYSVGSYWLDVTNNVSYVCFNATTGAAVWKQTSSGGTGSLSTKTWWITDQKPNGTQGGTFTKAIWQTRILNTLTGDPATDVTLNTTTNRFTLTSGTYTIWAFAPASSVDSHQCRLYNVTTAAVATYGTSSLSYSTTLSVIGGFSLVITSTSTFELQHRCQTTNSTDGCGVATGFGGNEIYSSITIIKII